jgi:hypothetical protein
MDISTRLPIALWRHPCISQTPTSNKCNVTYLSTSGTIPMDVHYVRTNLQWFVSDQPRSSFEKRVVSTPRLIHSLHTMSPAKAAPDVLQERKRKKMALPEPLRFHMYQKRRYGATSSCMALWYAKSDREEREF